MQLLKATSLCGTLTVPGDKSISHRSIMLGALAKGTTKVTGFLNGADCLSTIACFEKLGISIERENTDKTSEAAVLIHGRGLRGLNAPSSVLDAGNSGTTTRLISGILAAQPFTTTLTGDASIQKRPMGRIITPLSLMGAHIESINGSGCAPLRISGSPLHGITYNSPVASAQVKSAILLAGLYADTPTTVVEPALSRNHSELMLKSFGARLSDTHIGDNGSASVTITPTDELYAQEITVPSDISSAAYFLAAALIVPNSEITVTGVGINPTRDGIIKVIKAMGGHIAIENCRESGGELLGDITVKTSTLHGTIVGGSLIPTLIDELPVIAVLACFADGDTIIKDAAELKVKESNRIDTMAENLRAMGAHIETTGDGMIIHGGQMLHGASLKSYADHRIAMSMAVAALAADGSCKIDDMNCVKISYPTFWETLRGLCQHTKA